MSTLPDTTRLKRKQDATTFILAMLGFVALIPLAMLYSGLVLRSLWYWFAVPLGAPEVSVVQSIGIAILVGFLVTDTNVERPQRTFGEALFLTVGYPTLVWGIGWLVHLFL